jgi:predicted transcriptional regulator
MEWNIGKFSLSVKKRQANKEKTHHGVSSKTQNSLSSNSALNFEEIQKLNEPLLKYIRSLSKEEITKRIQEVSVEYIHNDGDLARAKEILKNTGIVVIPRFIEEETIGNIENEISAILKLYEKHIDSEEYFEDDLLAIDRQSQITGYDNLAGHNKPVISVRQGQDRGMVDVFNIERLITENKDRLISIYKDKRLLQLLNFDKEVILSNINVYINNKILKTRGFHVDGFNIDYKGFIYLTDVLDLNNGPYCYVKNSNREDIWRKANIEISKLSPKKTESPFVDVESIIPVLAPKGSLVISDQSGVHSGFPQNLNGHRKVLVARYK